jgi:hypothetical protein
LYIPTLPVKLENGRVITPTGTWSGWYFSEELKDARNNYSYKITVHHSYAFDKTSNVFNKFIDHFYEIKKNNKELKN